MGFKKECEQIEEREDSSLKNEFELLFQKDGDGGMAHVKDFTNLLLVLGNTC